MPSSSTSTSCASPSATAAAAALLGAAADATALPLAEALFLRGAALRVPTALLPPLLVRLMTPGAARLVRLPAGRPAAAPVVVVGVVAWSDRSGAGVFRAVLARRGRSAAKDGCGSWLVALPRDAGRRVIVVVMVAVVEAASGSGLGMDSGLAERERSPVAVWAVRGSSCWCSCARLVWVLRVSLVGGKIGVMDFFGEMTGGRMGVSVGGSLTGGGGYTPVGPA